MFFPTLLHHFLRDTSEQYPDKEALVFENEHYTYSAINKRCELLANNLLDMGIKRQDKVVIFLDNTPELIISFYGISKAGGVFVIVNGQMKSKKLAYIIKDSGASILITHTSKQIVINEALKELNTPCNIIWIGQKVMIPKELLAVSREWDEIFANIDTINQSEIQKRLDVSNRTIDSDLATLIYTSGSTGEPKGVMSPHINMVSAAKSISQYLENKPQDKVLTVLPLSFDYGLFQVLMAFMYGGTIVLERSFSFLHNILKKIPQEKITGFPIVPTILAMILKMQNLDQYEFGSLRYISNTGAALPENHIRKIRQLFPNVTIYSMFGLTECKRVSYLPPSEIDKRPASVGKAIPNCDVFVLDSDGNQVKPGEIGELVIRGSNVMRGYWNAPELTAKTFRPGKYPGEILLHSGDNFKQDEEGYLYFLGRKDDMIKCKGERISAKEIENIICEYDGIVESAVIGVPDEVFGQAIKAFVVTDGKTTITENDLLKHCTINLEPFAVPKYIVFIHELPRSAHGKIDKKSLASRE